MIPLKTSPTNFLDTYIVPLAFTGRIVLYVPFRTTFMGTITGAALIVPETIGRANYLFGATAATFRVTIVSSKGVKANIW